MLYRTFFRYLSVIDATARMSLLARKRSSMQWFASLMSSIVFVWKRGCQLL
jgi:hypothetical protein